MEPITDVVKMIIGSLMFVLSLILAVATIAIATASAFVAMVDPLAGAEGVTFIAIVVCLMFVLSSTELMRAVYCSQEIISKAFKSLKSHFLKAQSVEL